MPRILENGSTEDELESARIARSSIKHRQHHKELQKQKKACSPIFLAQEEARRMGHNFVGTENILLGILASRTGIAFEVLTDLGVTLSGARREVELIVGRGSGFIAVEIPFTPRAKRVLELAWHEARELGHNYIDSEHLLLGLIRDGEGAGARALENLGVDLTTIRSAVLIKLAPKGR